MDISGKFCSIALLFCAFFSANAQKINPDYLKSIHIRSIGPAAMSGRITAITVDPQNPEIIYAGAASGGVWRSRSFGATWEPIFDKANTQSVGSLCINPRNPDEIWVGTGEGNPRNSQNFGIGIFRTLDGGKNWTNMGLRESRSIHRIIMHRDNPDIIWAAVSGSSNGPNAERGVFKTTDGGKSWRKVLYTNDLTGCADLVVDPQNPNKLIAAMWEYRRWPWYFKSGGQGSGLHVSYDGGETWEKRTSKDGLPEGELGRIGLAISKSNPMTVYALVEAKENALYKSTDGGQTWTKKATKGQGDRPFYYSEIYVDPTDENTLYTIFTFINKSIDGGNSFSQIAGWEIHLDHHAFWIHPDNPDYMIDGNDGGLNITRDGGKTWHFSENIPAGQFYHITLDNDTPYNIYGGLQDNGTWVGPSAVWKSGSIRNSDWREIGFGDGFDAFAQADDNRFAYVQSQGGELYLVDVETGDNRYIKPVHPDGKTALRFNWNSGLSEDPFNPKGVYFGSNHLHYSANGGQEWQIISPDLTTADTSKMKADKSGGLTPDATNAENHCTIVAIAASGVQRGVIWVGTDDGNVQLTTDGGKTWTNFAKKLPSAPEGAWVPQIEVSAKNAGEAFVVLNNYRQNDWQPYLYHTKDFGKTWARLADARSVEGFCLSVVQDPEVENLLFLGTDQGLWMSIDYGKTWTRWPLESFPACPVQDMKIHKRDGDLVIGTFGRAIWILDDLRPLRGLAKTGPDLFKTPFKMFPTQDAIFAAWRSYDGIRFTGHTIFTGENKSPQARFVVWTNPEVFSGKNEKAKGDKEKKEKDKEKTDKKADEKASAKKNDEKITVTVMSMSGDTLRRFKAKIDSCFSSFTWSGDTKGVRMPSNTEPDKDQLEPWGGAGVLPGTYKVVCQYGDHKDSTTVTWKADPRLSITTEQMKAKADALTDFNKSVERATKAYDRLKEAEKTLKLVEEQWVNVPDSTKKKALDLAKPLRDSISALKELYLPQKEGKGIQRNPDNLRAMIWQARNYLEESSPGAPNPTARTVAEKVKTNIDATVERINKMFETDWRSWRAAAEAVQFSLFKDFERL